VKTVWKFPLTLNNGPQHLRIPVHSQPLHVDTQDGKNICLWALVEPDLLARTTLTIVVLGTGEETKEEHLWHLGSVLCGKEVWHVFVQGSPGGLRRPLSLQL